MLCGTCSWFIIQITHYSHIYYVLFFTKLYWNDVELGDSNSSTILYLSAFGRCTNKAQMSYSEHSQEDQPLNCLLVHLQLNYTIMCYCKPCSVFQVHNLYSFPSRPGWYVKLSYECFSDPLSRQIQKRSTQRSKKESKYCGDSQE